MARTSRNESALPFPPYGSFVNFLDDLNAMGVLPNRINAQVFGESYSGSTVNQVLRALRLFGLIEDGGEPNEAVLRRVTDPNSRRDAMEQLLRGKYAGLFALPLATAGPGEVNQWFASAGMDSTATRKAKAFFLTAARENGIDVHSTVASRSPRRGPRGKRKTNAKRKEGLIPEPSAAVAPSANLRELHPAVQAWIDEMPARDTTWDRTDFEGWLAIFKASVERAYKISPKTGGSVTTEPR